MPGAKWSGVVITPRPDNPAFREDLLPPVERAYLHALAAAGRQGRR